MNFMWAWLLFFLGAYHGLNPAMGWLFAVALGLQEKTGRAVVNALLPLGAGHLISVGLIVGVAQLAQLTVSASVVRIVSGTALILFGIYRFIRRRHPRWVGMRVGSRELAFWSFLMASAHGAGLMLLPFVIGSSVGSTGGSHLHHPMMAGVVLPAQWWLPVGLHTLGYLFATAALALLVYYKFGLAVLRGAWFNLELLWVGALVAIGALTLAI